MPDTCRQIIVATLLGLLFQVSATAQRNADRGWNYLNRKIKSDLIETTNYKYESGTWVIQNAFFVEQTFSPEGRVVLARGSNMDGSNRYQMHIAYDGEGRLTGKKHYAPDGNLVESCVNTFGIHGKIDSAICTSSTDEVLSASTYKYDSAGREIEFLLTKKGSQPFKKVSTYDEKGNLLETLSYQGDKRSRRETYSYDGGIKTKRWGGKVEVGDSVIKAGDMVEIIEIYNLEGKLAEQIFTLNGSPTQRAISTYGSKGGLAEEARYDPDGKLFSKTTYDYKYDSQNNWIETASTQTTGEGEPISKSVSKRTIIYDEENRPNPQNLISNQEGTKKRKPQQ
jgi:hypothetical protein